MDRPRLIAGCLRHALRCTAGRRRQKNLHLFLFKVTDDGVDGSCLTGTGSSGDNEQAAVDRLDDRADLQLIRLNAFFFTDLLQLFADLRFRLSPTQIQIMEHTGRVKLCIVILGSVNMAGGRGTVILFRLQQLLLIHLYHDLLLHLKICQMFLHHCRIYMQKLRRRCQQLLLRQVGMSVCHGLQQRIINAAANPEIRIREYSHFLSNLICHFKSDALDVIRQAVGIFLDNAVHPGTVFVVDFEGQTHGDAVFLQKHHGLAHLLLGLHLLRNSLGHFFADSLYLCQTLRFFLNDAEGICLEPPHNAGSQCCTNTTDRAGSQIALHGCRIFRSFQLIRFHLDLVSVNGMLHITAGCLNKISFTDIREGSHQYIVQSIRIDT